MRREAVLPHAEASPDCGRNRASTSLDEQAPVLLVDDMAVVRATVATCLQAEGHLVVTAANGKEALELLRNGLTPFAIILDLVMPRKNGFQLRMAQMNDRRLAQIPTAAYSSAPWLKERAESLGLEFFHKPLGNEALLAVYWKDGTKSDVGG